MTGVTDNGMSLLVGFCYEGKKNNFEFPISGYPFMETHLKNTYEGNNFAIDIRNENSVYKISIRAEGHVTVPYYVYLKVVYKTGRAWSFNGQEDKRTILRQSPHDPSDHIIDIPKQAFPVAAVKNGNSFVALFSDNPAVYDNYSTQELNHISGYILVSSSDSGENIQEDGKKFKRHFFEEPKSFDFFIAEFESDSLQAFRLNLFIESSRVFSSEKSLFNSILFASNYMHYRKNETGFSNNWIVPGIDYSNKQYTRDAFWQSMILPLEMEQQIYDAVYPERYRYAENALIYIIWSYRLKQNGGNPNYKLLRDAFAYIKENVTGGIYRAPRTNGKPSFRSWYDICAFEDDDIITYNQGLYAVAVRCLVEFGIYTREHASMSSLEYRNLFNHDKGYFPLSKNKEFFTVDALAGDILHMVLFDEKLLSDDYVRSHYTFMNKYARTDFGYKVTCDNNGNYLRAVDFGIPGHIEEYYSYAKPGMYAWGGSYFLYDMLCMLACFIHLGDKVIDDMIKRTRLEILVHGALHEHMNTSDGKPGKANQGWNAAIYAISEKLRARYPSISKFIGSVDDIILEVIKARV